jgi:hypothetical protein
MNKTPLRFLLPAVLALGPVVLLLGGCGSSGPAANSLGYVFARLPPANIPLPGSKVQAGKPVPSFCSDPSVTNPYLRAECPNLSTSFATLAPEVPDKVQVGKPSFCSDPSVTNPYLRAECTNQSAPFVTLAPVAPDSSTTSPTVSGRSDIALHKNGGTFAVPVSINDAMTLEFTIDSGAADVSIPADVVMTLMRTGTINHSDFLGSRTILDAADP